MKNIEIAYDKPVSKTGAGRVCYETLFGGLFFISIYMSYASLFGLSFYFRWILAIGGLMVLAVSIFSEKKQLILLVMVGVSLVFAVLVLTGSPLVRDGLKVTANRVLEVFGKAGRGSYRQFSLSGDAGGAEEYAACFLAFLAVGLAFFCGIFVKYRKKLLAAVFVVPVFVIQVLLKGEPDLFFTLLMVLMVLLLCCSGFLKEVTYRALFLTAGGAAAVLFLFFLAASLIFPESGYAKSFLVQDIKSAVHNVVWDLRYEKGKPNSFTQGDFLRLSHLELWEEPALEVVMDHPQSYYLRGFVGSRYTSSKWEPLDAEKVYDNYPLYYWLHQTGFSSLNQLYLLEKQSVGGEEPEQAQIQIENVNANSRYLYTPYELSRMPEDFSGTKTVEEDTLLSEEWSGQRSYSYTAVKSMTGRYPQVLAAMGKADVDKEKAAEYQKNELNYRAKVYGEYLEIPPNVNGLLNSLLGGKAPLQQEFHVDYQEALEFIRGYLEEEITYDTAAKGVSRGTDFLTDVLQTTKKGYSVHFATAAAMMFRYMGIPSRYVEGYLITPDDIQGVQDNETIEILGMNGHAWVEIYQDGIGWIPMEVTPPYYGIMEQAQIPGSSLAEAVGEGSEGGEEGGGGLAEVEPPEKADTLDKSGMDLLTALKIAAWVLLGIAAAAVLGLVLFLYIRRKKTISRRALQFADEDKGRAICHMYVYIQQILSAAGIEKTGASLQTYGEGIGQQWTKAYARRYQLILSISQKAAFSTHEMEDAEWKDVWEYKDMILLKLLDGPKWNQKLKWKYLYCLY